MWTRRQTTYRAVLDTLAAPYLQQMPDGIVPRMRFLAAHWGIQDFVTTNIHTMLKSLNSVAYERDYLLVRFEFENNETTVYTYVWEDDDEPPP